MMRVRKLAGRAGMAALGLFAGVAACGDVQVPVVVLGDRPTAVERFAAEELAGELGKCLGVKPVVASESASLPRPRLYVGATKASAALGARGEGWPVDGVRLKSVADGAVLDGDPARAPIYAVDLYLEKYCGVRWWTDRKSVV